MKLLRILGIIFILIFLLILIDHYWLGDIILSRNSHTYKIAKVLSSPTIDQAKEQKVSTDGGMSKEDHSAGDQANTEEYIQLLDSTLKELPTKDAIKGLNAAEVHATPKVIIQSAMQIGVITDKMKSDKRLRPEAFEFYKKCATQDQVIASIRAVCLLRARELSEELFSQKLDIQVPAEVEKLAW